MPTGVAYQLQHYAGELFLAGGAIRAIWNHEPVNDVDLFAATPFAASGAAHFLRCGIATEKMHITANAFTVKDVTPNVQIVRREYYPTPQAVLDSFDFTICKAVIWWDGNAWQSLTDAKFSNDVTQKRLSYCSPARQDPRDSLLRVLKFYARGYSIDARSLAKIVAQTVIQTEGGVEVRLQDLENGLALNFAGTSYLADQLKTLRVCGSSRNAD